MPSALPGTPWTNAGAAPNKNSTGSTTTASECSSLPADSTPNDEEPIKPSKSQCKPSRGMLLLFASLRAK